MNYFFHTRVTLRFSKKRRGKRNNWSYWNAIRLHWSLNVDGFLAGIREAAVVHREHLDLSFFISLGARSHGATYMFLRFRKRNMIGEIRLFVPLGFEACGVCRFEIPSFGTFVVGTVRIGKF